VFGQPVDPGHIKVVGRFVKKQNVPLADEKSGEADSTTLTSGQITNSGIDVDIAEQTGEHIANHRRRRPLVLGAFPDDHVSNRLVITEMVILGQHSDLRPTAHRDTTRIRSEGAANNRHECRLTVAVTADDTDAAVALWAFLHGYIALERAGMLGANGQKSSFTRGVKAMAAGLRRPGSGGHPAIVEPVS
jgi:hypothetical protein